MIPPYPVGVGALDDPRQTGVASLTAICVILSEAQIKCRMQSAECRIKGERFDTTILVGVDVPDDPQKQAVAASRPLYASF